MTTVNLPKQLQFLFQPHRYKIAYGGRGSGKSWGFAIALLLLAAQKPMRVLCAREVQKSIKQSVHTLLSDQIQSLGLGAISQVLETEIRFANGSTFSFAGLASHTVESIKSFEGCDIVWIEEGQTISKRSWNILIPTIRKPGSEIWVTFNPDLDTDDTYVRFVLNPPASARVVKMNYSDNPWFPEVLEQERLHCQTHNPADYENIWEGNCKSAVDGAIYAAEIAALQEEGRLCHAPYDPTLKVHTVWDLGWNDSMCIALVQRSPSGEVRIIDYIEDSHRTLDSYVMQLIDMRLNWGFDFLPHDGRTKDFKSGKSSEEILTAMGRTVQILGRDDVEEGIKLARMMFGRLWVDKKAGELIDRLKRYRRMQNQKTLEFGAPLHDENSHGADCLRYVAMAEPQMNNSEWSGNLNYPRIYA
jgi:phage terminase large subunit